MVVDGFTGVRSPPGEVDDAWVDQMPSVAEAGHLCAGCV